MCLELVQESTYDYVRGQAWHVLASYHRMRGKLDAGTIASLTPRAITLAKQSTAGDFMEKWGALNFLCSSEEVSGKRHSLFLSYLPPLLQSMVAPMLPRAAFAPAGVVKSFLSRSSFEPGLSVSSRLRELAVEPANFGLSADQLPTQVQNTLRELGLIASPKAPVDPVAEVLLHRYGLARGKTWHVFLGSEYVHAVGLLKQAEAAFSANISFWLVLQNAFNHAIFIALQRHLKANRLPGECSTVGRNGQLVDFGVMLDNSGPFATQYPGIADAFRDMNARRNHLPPVHPYDKKTGGQTQYLKAQERNRYVGLLKTAYQEFAQLVP